MTDINQPGRPSNAAVARRRALAFLADWTVIAVWGGALFGLVMVATAGRPQPPSSPWLGQILGFLTMTVPTLLYFAVFESSRFEATLGKRLLGLRVCDLHGQRLRFGSAILRNGLKFVPWEAGHLVAQQAIHSGDAGLPVWVWPVVAVSFAGPLWWMGALVATGHTPYDRWSGTRVAER